jgi:drug/metabolite transporter (DMT)-like permease
MKYCSTPFACRRPNQYCSGQTVVWMEGLGVLTAFGGCILCAGDEAHDSNLDSNDGSSAAKTLTGDFLALGSALTGVCYLTFAKAVRPCVSVTVFMFMVMLSGCMLCIVYIVATGISWSFDNDPVTGLFGWLTFEGYHIFILLYIAVVCNVIGTMGFVRAMEFFDNIIITVATLLEPMIATLIAFALGVGDLPGTFGWIGNFLVAVGTFFVVYPSMKDGGGGGGH